MRSGGTSTSSSYVRRLDAAQFGEAECQERWLARHTGRRTVRVGRLPGLPLVQPVGRDCVAQDGLTVGRACASKAAFHRA